MILLVIFEHMDQLIDLLLTYKYLILLPLSIVEGPIVTVIVGFLSSMNLFNPFAGYGIVLLGDFLGDTLLYLTGRFGNKIFSSKFGKKLGINQEKMENARIAFNIHRKKTIILSKIFHGIGIVGLMAAGTAKIPFFKFIRVCLLTSVIQAGILLFVGIFFGHAYLQLNKYLDYFAAITIILGILVILFFIVKKKLKFNLER